VTAATERKLRLREQRRATRLAGARRLPLCALALLFMFAAQVFAQTKPALPTEEKTIESLLTNAGTLAIVQLGEDTDLKMELRLKGKKVYAIEGNMTAGFVAQFRTFSSGEIIVMTVGEGGTACPAQFQIVHVEDTGKVSVTDEFGDCGDSPTITLQQLPDEQITFRFQGFYRLSEAEEPGFRKPPPTTYVYRKGVLKELKSAPPTPRRGK
jgi:hypothetical protein